ncbi:hypothetical protein QVD17_01760 [Tagetes erecta]|uniref:Uncharacterized protein n=1 Tax=Tagetes erecta TaxID=13708 RepID=A0AAD8LBA1_TARER|nr:hypothetical protein QVD17_01760 [Tagetes erecta]
MMVVVAEDDQVGNSMESHPQARANFIEITGYQCPTEPQLCFSLHLASYKRNHQQIIYNSSSESITPKQRKKWEAVVALKKEEDQT